jgi:hypothetical protein
VKDKDQSSDQQEQDNIFVTEMGVPRIVSYNFSEGERPGRMLVRAKIRVVTGRHAAVLDAVQAQAIRELLLWSRQQRTNNGQQV